MKTIKVMTVFGTRPEAIKMAPLIHALEQAPDLESVVCVTAQHREMLDQVMEIFRLKADYDLNIMQPRQTLATITTKSLAPTHCRSMFRLGSTSACSGVRRPLSTSSCTTV